MILNLKVKEVLGKREKIIEEYSSSLGKTSL